MTEIETLRRYADHDPADIEDAVQETLLRLAKRAKEVHASITNWLHRCAVRMSLDRVRCCAERGGCSTSFRR